MGWYGHALRMAEGEYLVMIHECNMPGMRTRGGPRKGNVDGVNESAV